MAQLEVELGHGLDFYGNTIDIKANAIPYLDTEIKINGGLKIKINPNSKKIYFIYDGESHEKDII